jgi:hypothetical protein
MKLNKFLTIPATLCSICLAWQVAQSYTIEVPSREAPTISAAMIRAKAGDSIVVQNGTYKEHVFIKSGTMLVARNQYKARIDGGGRGTVVTMGKNCVIHGFEITNGTVGVFTTGAENAIERCRIFNNWQTGLVVVRHLPKVEDNVIVFNRASGIQGWDVRATVGSINHNTIAFNTNNGISLGGNSNIIIENNVIAFNERFGLKMSDDAKNTAVFKNNFYHNLTSPQAVPDGNFSFDPVFISPRVALNFKPNPKFCCKMKGSDGEEIGVRIYDDL